MMTSTLHALSQAEPPARARFTRAPHSFEQDLMRMSDDRAALEDAAAKFVSSAFVMPMFQSMQQSPLRPTEGAFAMGAAEKRFAPLLHQHFADRVTQSSKLSIVNAIVERFASRLKQETLNVRA